MSVLLDVQDLCVDFRTDRGSVRPINGVSFQLRRGEILGLVGESGSGKSVTGLALMRLLSENGRIAAGRVVFEGTDLVTLTERQMHSLRGRRLSMVFQDPMTTLNPVLRIDTQIIEAVRAHEKVSRKAAFARAVEALKSVGITSPKERLESYPHQFSGGMRQRVAIAIALLHRPALLIADEPTTALDVSIQSQILYEVQKLVADSGTSLIWVTHDLSVVAGLVDRLAVMYAGRLVEIGSTAAVLERPMHRYTRGLIRSVPTQNERGRPMHQIQGIAPPLTAMPEGCAFRPRCERADEACKVAMDLEEGRDLSHFHRCRYPIQYDVNLPPESAL